MSPITGASVSTRRSALSERRRGCVEVRDFRNCMHSLAIRDPCLNPAFVLQVPAAGVASPAMSSMVSLASHMGDHVLLRNDTLHS